MELKVLPHEIFVEILLFLPLNDIYKCMQINQSFYRASKENFLWNKKLDKLKDEFYVKWIELESLSDRYIAKFEFHEKIIEIYMRDKRKMGGYETVKFLMEKYFNKNLWDAENYFIFHYYIWWRRLRRKNIFWRVIISCVKYGIVYPIRCCFLGAYFGFSNNIFVPT